MLMSDNINTDSLSHRKVVLPNELLYEHVKELVDEGHTVSLKVKGYSMTPFLINERDSVCLGAFEKDNLKKGDIILGKSIEDQIVLHRIIRVDENSVVLRGDGNSYGTETVDKDKIAGIVLSAVRNNRNVDFNTTFWLGFSKIWNVLYPVRRILLFIYRRIF